MKPIIYAFLMLAFYGSAHSQNEHDILLQFSGQSITIRKMKENNQMWYSEKHDRLITCKEEFSAYPDSYYHLAKPIITIFSSKMFKTDAKEQINIRVDYFYHKRMNGMTETKEIERWQKSYYPFIQKIVKVEDTRKSDGKCTLTMDDNSVWILETEKDDSISLFYVTQEGNVFLDYALMFPNCKKEIENGFRR